MRPSWSVVCRGARVDLLVSKPPFDLQKPACSKVTLVPENSRVSVDPVLVERSERKIRVVYPLFVRDASWITTVKPTGVELEGQQLVLVRPPAHIQISLPYIILAIVALP